MAHDSRPAGTASPVVVRAPFRERASWAMYDFANTIFSMNVATLYFSVWLIADMGASSTVYAIGNGISSLLVVLSVPVLGAISDAKRRRVPWVVGFTIASCIACAAIGILGQTTLPIAGESTIGGTQLGSGWHPGFGTFGWVMLAFIVANYTYQAAQPFYNAMMPELVPPEEQGRLSGVGTAVGYIGTIVGLILIFPFFSGELPPHFALPPGILHALRTVVPYSQHAGRVSTFVPTAILFLAFSLPLMLFCRDHNVRRAVVAPAGVDGDVMSRAVAQPAGWRAAFSEVARTLRDARRYPGALSFIFASFLYQDAIGTIVSFMALYAVKAMGFAKGSETTLFLVLTIPAIIGSYAAGFLVDRFGARRTLILTVVGWIILLFAMIAAPSQGVFWGVGVMIGLVFGGVPTAERPMLLSLVPAEEAGRFFSLMLLSSRAAAVVGPLVWSVTVDWLEPARGTGLAYRAAVITVAVMFAASLVLLRRVPDVRAARAAHA